MPEPRTLAERLANTSQALAHCEKQESHTFTEKHTETLEELCEILPSGSGFDNGTEFMRHLSSDRKLVFETSFHHMNEHGYYEGWTSHRVTVFAEFGGFDVKVSGPDKNDIKEYIAETFYHCLQTLVPENQVEETKAKEEEQV